MPTAFYPTPEEIDAVFKQAYSKMKWGGNRVYFDVVTRPLPWLAEAGRTSIQPECIGFWEMPPGYIYHWLVRRWGDV